MVDKEKVKERENQILELSKAFCAQYLDEEYQQMVKEARAKGEDISFWTDK